MYCTFLLLRHTRCHALNVVSSHPSRCPEMCDTLCESVAQLRVGMIAVSVAISGEINTSSRIYTALMF